MGLFVKVIFEIVWYNFEKSDCDEVRLMVWLSFGSAKGKKTDPFSARFPRQNIVYFTEAERSEAEEKNFPGLLRHSENTLNWENGKKDEESGTLTKFKRIAVLENG